MIIRCEHHSRTPEPLVEIDEEEESILNVDHQGMDWWIYIARWADDDA